MLVMGLTSLNWCKQKACMKQNTGGKGMSGFASEEGYPILSLFLVTVAGYVMT